MKILITGSSGFVGTHLVKKLTKNHKIIRYDLKGGQNILDKRLLTKKLKGVDLVIHLAALISASESWVSPYAYFENNLLGTLAVITSAINAGVKKIIFFSSAAVKAKPFTPYSISKISAENAVKLYSDKIETLIIRPENIYGAGQKESYGYVVHNFIKAVISEKPIRIFGTGSHSRDFVYIDNVVQTVEKLVKLNIKSGSVISIGTGRETKVTDLANIVMEVVNKKVNIVHLEKRKEPIRSHADLKSMKTIGINPKGFVGVKDGIRKLLKIQYNKSDEAY